MSCSRSDLELVVCIGSSVLRFSATGAGPGAAAVPLRLRAFAFALAELALGLGFGGMTEDGDVHGEGNGSRGVIPGNEGYGVCG